MVLIHFHVISVQMVQMFSHCVLGSVDEMDLDELLATKLVTFMMEHHNMIFQVPSKLHYQVEEHLSHLKRVQVSTFYATTVHKAVVHKAIHQRTIPEESALSASFPF